MCNDKLLEGFDIDVVIQDLMKKREIFTSEADFQLALSRAIEEKYDNAKVRREYCPESYPNRHIDFLVLWEANEKTQWIPIELKYKPVAFRYTDKDRCLYDLKNQGAHNDNFFHYWNDVSRINDTANLNQFKIGFAILLTNDSWYEENIRWPIENYSINTRTKELNLSGDFTLEWKSYSTLIGTDNSQTEFKILITTIKK